MWQCLRTPELRMTTSQARCANQTFLVVKYGISMETLCVAGVGVKSFLTAFVPACLLAAQEIGQWAIGGPSVFLWGLGLLPYKDTWITTSATPLNRKSPR
eukprot:COSAG02_NODE_38507_length_428_cov_0.826748_1_plen_99_part_01